MLFNSFEYVILLGVSVLLCWLVPWVRARHSLDFPVQVSAILHEANGPTVADWHSGRSGFMASPGGEFQVELGPAQLCPGYYQFVLVGFGPDGTQHFLSRPLRFRVVGDYFGSTRVQPMAVWTETSGQR
ncbi:MAG: hypothetical protein QM612_01400 [Thermomonas sp.]|uniref:hypothetical protein n=1 Tax=Thermomonas sp. TaxID=1971895 RepID=UPI0039E31C59